MVYQFKIKLRNIKKPPVWRRVEVPGQFTFTQLHRVIQAAFEWGSYHLWHFTKTPYGPEFCIKEPNEWDEDDDFLDARRITLDRFYNKGNDLKRKLLYTYDFGDDWHHDCVVEGVLDEHRLYACCTGGKGGAPYEDCGGPWGWEDMKEVGEVDDEEVKYFDLAYVDALVKVVR